MRDRRQSQWLCHDFLFRFSPLCKEQERTCRTIHDYTRSVIEERREITGGTAASVVPGGRRMAFLDVLLSSKTEDGKGLSTEEIVDEVNTFLVAGHETTAGSLLWLLFALGGHLEVQVLAVPAVATAVVCDPLSSVYDFFFYRNASTRRYPASATSQRRA